MFMGSRERIPVIENYGAKRHHFNSEETIQQRQGELCRLLALRSIQVIFKMKFLKLLKESPNMLSWDSLFNDQISSDKKCCIRNLAGRALGVDKYVLIGTDAMKLR
mmetsp:Transcript_60718/g.162266  ORF Transcript_60718/g.162266 Transcript_60718/m.162266 type:complete len:106 (+) Transcript_60718:1337-1654(+)